MTVGQQEVHSKNWTWVFAVFILWVASLFAHAHTVSFARIQLKLNQANIGITLELPVIDLQLIAPDLRQSGVLSAAARRKVESLVLPRLQLEVESGKLSPKLLEVKLDSKNLYVTLEYPKPPVGELRLSAWLVPENALHKTFVDVYSNTNLERQLIFDAQTRTQTIVFEAKQSILEVIWAFVLEGLHHILIGLDHILFVVSLLLAGGGFWTLLRITTAFTLAHSLTLSLAVLGVFAPPASFVEPAIAASIIFVAIDSLRPKNRDLRIWFAFGFGLIHGFGFANALQEMKLPAYALAWSLASFNIGVELGQACIVLTIAPILWWLRTHVAKPLTHRIITTATWTVVIVAGVWFVQRIGGW